MLLKYISILCIIILALLLLFFGMGPVIFADGSAFERIITLFIVLILYILLGLIFRKVLTIKKDS